MMKPKSEREMIEAWMRFIGHCNEMEEMIALLRSSLESRERVDPEVMQLRLLKVVREVALCGARIYNSSGAVVGLRNPTDLANVIRAGEARIRAGAQDQPQDRGTKYP